MTYLAAFGRHASSFIGVTLLTSLAFQNLLHRRISAAERDRLTAHQTILESLVKRLREGEDLSKSEIVRLVRLARGGGEEGGGIENTPWKEVVFGKRLREVKEIEGKALEEWNTAIAQAEQPAKPRHPVPAPTPSNPTPLSHALAPAPKKPTFFARLDNKDKSRDDPSVIKTRLTAVTASTACSLLAVVAIVWKTEASLSPLTEELVFRSCIVGAAKLAGIGHKKIIFLTPLWFGLAHIHHGHEQYNRLGRTRKALQRTLVIATVQLGYTTLFGWYASFLFLRTGSVITPTLAHAFCNVMGMPTVQDDVRQHPNHKLLIWLTHAVGIVGFGFALGPWTRAAE
ncbi:CAAX prenyl protease 2 [Rhizoctonia solani]|uniref:intramembrane prenyl-peptidase Rce1 n=1 Tax=Rhizoctonia solani TaxID=456999 RepID=A0A8H8P538_9AGAM|nr:CAAX prenyl protease 2 [Rhizoctonia solani]QRW25420.1 CAAX prenyl protease 2 [Rhizoctonia solani]